nr:MAG TPA: Terminase small subunit [Caudoviricetes sp.]
MPRIRDPNRDKAFEIYKKHSGNIDLVEIASQLSVPPGTVRGWKAKDKWEQQLNGTLQTNTERSKRKKQNVKKDKVEPEIQQLDKSELTDKQKLFCIYQVKYFNATKAYQKAYGCSYDVANAEGYKLLVNPRIKAEVQRLKQAKLNRVMLGEDDIFQKMIDIAFADITDYVKFGKKEVEVGKTKNGEPIIVKVNYTDFRESDEVDGTLISEVKQGKDGISVKLHDKMKALQWLADRMDLLSTEDQIRHKNESDKLNMLKEKHAKEMGDNNKEPIKIEFVRASQRGDADE